MRFNCGPTAEEKELIKATKKVEYLKNWHKQFIILPLRLNKNECLCFEWVQVRYPYAYIHKDYYFAPPKVEENSTFIVKLKSGEMYLGEYYDITRKIGDLERDYYEGI